MDSSAMLAQIRNAIDELKKRQDQINNLLESFDNLDMVRGIYHAKYHKDSDIFKGKGVVYSAITGGYDFVNEPEVISKDVDYVMFTDELPEEYSGAWEMKVLDNPEKLSAPMLARWCKMHPFTLFPEYDWSIWVDGALSVKGDVKEYIDVYARESGMVCFPHHRARDIREEAQGIIAHGKADENELGRQISRYEQEGYVGKGYIIESGVLLRSHHDEKLKQVMEDWWKEMCTYEHNRDQMSFDYACWKNDYDYDLNDLLIYGNPWFEALSVH